MARTKARTIRRKMKVEMIPECVFGILAYYVAHEHMMQLLDGPYAAFAPATRPAQPTTLRCRPPLVPN
jgi:hypothetical protein